MSSSLAVPSPPGGVPIGRRGAIPWLRSFVLRNVAEEPSDTAARVTIAATLLPLVPPALGLLLGLDPVASFLFLARFSVLPVFPLMLVAQMSGLVSRSASARFVAGITTAFLAGGLALASLGDTSNVFFQLSAQLYRPALYIGAALWLVRSLRRHLADGAV